MGYTLIIGNAKLDYDKEYRYLKVIAERVELPNAPAYGEPTDNCNERWPSYTAWANFCRFVGLYDLFYKKDNGEEWNCLIHEHSGFTALHEDHQTAINKAYDDFYKKYPNCKAGYSPKINEKEGVYEDKDWPEENNYAVRLEWLKFWVDWAMANCEMPIMYNS